MRHGAVQPVLCVQGVKKGIMEVADMVVVNKSDGDLIPYAVWACAACHAARCLPRLVCVVTLTGVGRVAVHSGPHAIRRLIFDELYSCLAGSTLLGSQRLGLC